MLLNAVPAHASAHVDTTMEQRSRLGKNLFGRVGKGEQKFLLSYSNKGKIDYMDTKEVMYGKNNSFPFKIRLFF